jgi:hypothetical protein
MSDFESDALSLASRVTRCHVTKWSDNPNPDPTTVPIFLIVTSIDDSVRSNYEVMLLDLTDVTTFSSLFVWVWFLSISHSTTIDRLSKLIPCAKPQIHYRMRP